MAKIKVQKITFGADLSGFQQYFVVNETYASQKSNGGLSYGKLIRIEGATAVFQLLSTDSFINGSIATSTGAVGTVKNKVDNTVTLDLLKSGVPFIKEALIIDGNQPYTPISVSTVTNNTQSIEFGSASIIGLGSIIHQGSLGKFGSKSVSGVTEEEDTSTANKPVKPEIQGNPTKFTMNAGTGGTFTITNLHDAVGSTVEYEANTDLVDVTKPSNTQVRLTAKSTKNGGVFTLRIYLVKDGIKSDPFESVITVNKDPNFVDSNKKVKIVKFAANGGTGTMNDEEIELNSVQVDYTVPPSTFVAPNGKQFKTWLGQNNTEYAPGAIIKFGNTEEFTFTAQWEDAPVVTPPAQATISVSPDTVDFTKDKVQKLLITTTEIDAQALNLKVVGSEDVVSAEFNTFSGKACSLTLTLKDNVPDNINSKFVVKSGGDSVVSNEVTITRTLDHTDTTPPQTTTKKYYVVAVAGQSNSVGYDESTWDDSFRDTTGRIKQLGYYNDDNLKVIECMPCAQNIQNMSDLPDANYAPGGYGVTKKGTKGLHLPLGQELLKVIPEGYDVLIIPVAYGMTGFTTKGGQQYDVNLKKLLGSGVNANWSKDQALYKTLEARILHALDMNADNKFLGVIWCQGEVDTDRNLETLKTGFQGIVDALSTALSKRTNQLVGGKADKSLWYVHETTLFWRQYQGNQKCSEIWKWYKEFLGEKNYIRIPPDIDRTNQTNGGDKRTSSAWSSHFGNNAYRDIIAPRVVKQISDTTQLVVPEVKKDPATLDVQIQKFNLDTIVSEVPVTIQSTSPISVEISDLDIVSYDTTSKKFVIGTKNGSAIVTVKTVDDNKLNVASTFVIHVSGLTELQDAPMYRVTGKEVGKTLVTVKASKEGSTPVETIMIVRVIEPRETLTINFDLNGGSSIENLAPVTIKRGDLFKLPEADIIPPADKESFVYFELITSKHERILIMKSSEISTARFDSVNTLKAIYK